MAYATTTRPMTTTMASQPARVTYSGATAGAYSGASAYTTSPTFATAGRIGAPTSVISAPATTVVTAMPQTTYAAAATNVAYAAAPVTTYAAAPTQGVVSRPLSDDRVIRRPAVYKSDAPVAPVQVDAPVDDDESMFKDVEVAPPDAILSLATRFKEDKFPKKVNLGIGAYRTEEGKPWPLPSVLAAQFAVVTDPTEDKEYVPIDGKPEHKKHVQQLIFSDAEVDSGCIATTQAISGTGSLQMIGQFLSNFMNCTILNIPNPTWGNHTAIFKRAGVDVKPYTYYKEETRGFDFEGMVDAMSQMQAGEAILLHACAQNPTGVDPTAEQWTVIVNLCRERGLIPVLDNAYQGYASGSLEKDGLSLQMFEDAGLEYFVAQSFAKNFGLYGERIGYIHVRCTSPEIANAVLSQLKILIRQAYSSPPRHGAAIVHKILSNPTLKQNWLDELLFMANRILDMRDALRAAIEAKGTPGTWNHITDQIGMFSFTGLNTDQVARMVDEFHIYMTKDGRISVAGLNPGNISYVAECIDIVVREA